MGMSECERNLKKMLGVFFFFFPNCCIMDARGMLEGNRVHI